MVVCRYVYGAAVISSVFWVWGTELEVVLGRSAVVDSRLVPWSLYVLVIREYLFCSLLWLIADVSKYRVSVHDSVVYKGIHVAISIYINIEWSQCI